MTENSCHKAYATPAVRDLAQPRVTRAAPAIDSKGPVSQEGRLVEMEECSHLGGGPSRWFSLTPSRAAGHQHSEVIFQLL